MRPVGISRTHGGQDSPVGASGRTIASSSAAGTAARSAASASTHCRSMPLAPGQAITAVTVAGFSGMACGSAAL